MVLRYSTGIYPRVFLATKPSCKRLLCSQSHTPFFNFKKLNSMKKNTLLLLALVLAGSLAYLASKKNKGEKAFDLMEDARFAFPKEEISKIVIENPGIPKMTLTKRGQKWIINGQYEASRYVIDPLLTTVSKMELESIPSKNATQNIVENIKSKGIHVTIFDSKGKKAKSYKVGIESKDHSGTYFLMDGSKQPYNMRLKGFTGLMRNRFTGIVDLWRDKVIFREAPQNIKELTVEYHKKQNHSFRIKKEGNGYKVQPLNDLSKKYDRKADPKKINAYLGAYKAIYAENYDNKNKYRDSIIHLVPFATIALTNEQDEKTEVDIFPFNDILQYDVNTKDIKDLDRIERHFVYRNKKDFLVAQQKLLKPLFRSIDYFFE